MNTSSQGAPKAILTTRDTVAIIVGLVIGAGIFRFPPLVAANSPDEAAFYLLWIAGGAISLVGALCYAELATAYPSAGGDYYFIQRAFGRTLSFLFGWARLAVITTGAIALLGYTFGDYASNLLRLGPNSTAIYAALSVLALTAVNLLGIRETKSTQNVLTSLLVLGVIAVIVTGLLLVAPAPAAAAPAAPKAWTAAPFAMLFTFGYSYVALLVGSEQVVRRREARVLEAAQSEGALGTLVGRFGRWHCPQRCARIPRVGSAQRFAGGSTGAGSPPRVERSVSSGTRITTDLPPVPRTVSRRNWFPR